MFSLLHFIDCECEDVVFLTFRVSVDFQIPFHENVHNVITYKYKYTATLRELLIECCFDQICKQTLLTVLSALSYFKLIFHL